MRVHSNPQRSVDGEPVCVRHPVTGLPFPTGDFDLSADDLKNPNIRRLLPRGLGGVFGDLIPVVNTEKPTSGKGKS